MTNEEIVKNAPAWATHWAINIGSGFEPEYARTYNCSKFSDSMGRLFINDKWTFTPLDELKTTESVYVQEMKDNGEPVKVGMKFKIPSGECRVTAMVSLSNVAYETNHVIHTCLHSETYPIKSEREEAEEALIKKVAAVLVQPVPNVVGDWNVNLAKKLLEAGLLSEIILPLKRS